MLKQKLAIGALALVAACKPGLVPPDRTPGSGVSIDGTSGRPEGPLPPAPSFDKGVTVHLAKQFEDVKVVSFGLPIPRAVAVDPARVRVRVGGQPAEGVRVRPILFDLAKPKVPRSLLVQLPASVMTRPEIDIAILWSAEGPATSAATASYTEVKRESPLVVEVADRAIEHRNGNYQLVVKKQFKKTLYSGWEPAVLATYPAGYLARTGIFGELVSRDDVLRDPKNRGLAYLSDNLRPFIDGASYDEGFPVKPEAVVDPVTTFEGWLYDRCATFLIAYAHLGDPKELRHGLRACSYYGSKIRRTGPDAGTFGGKPEPDTKYSHVRGLYTYYALTGDEGALEASKLIAESLLNDPFFTTPYRKGSARGPDKLWTERLLAVDLESLIYAYALFGEPRYLQAFRELFDTAYRHISTKNQTELEAITKVKFPPQDCFVHSAEQHGEGEAKDPWCSGWMAELLVDPLLRYQETSGDPRVDEVFVRLARALRDRGTNYFAGDPQGDTFLSPKVCWDPTLSDPRLLVPLYGFGTYPSGVRKTFGEWADFEHCADATALTAAAIRGLKRMKGWDGPGVGPFKTEGASFLALHEELSYCARRAFAMWTRPARDPRALKSEELAEGFGFGLAEQQNAWMEKLHIGYPIHETAPTRKLSWWFNGSLAQYRLLDDAGVSFPRLRPGIIQAKGCQAVDPSVTPP